MNGNEFEGRLVNIPEIEKWIRWLLGVVDSTDTGVFANLGIDWWLDYIVTLWKWGTSRDRLTELQTVGRDLLRDLGVAEANRERLKAELANTQKERDRLREDVDDAEGYQSEVAQDLDDAQQRRDDLFQELDSAQDHERETQISLERERKRVNELDLYRIRVAAIQSEYAAAAEHVEKQLHHYKAAESLYVHLMDGGVVDNLGFSPLLELLESFERTERTTVREAFVLVVDARREPTYDFSHQRNPPGIFDTIVATTGTAIDSKSFLLANELERITGRLADSGVIKQRYIVRVGFDDITEHLVRSHRASDGSDDNSIDPNRLKYYERCQRWFQNIETSWSLRGEQVEALVDMGEILVVGSESYRKFVEQAGGVNATPKESAVAVCERVLPDGGNAEKGS